MNTLRKIQETISSISSSVDYAQTMYKKDLGEGINDEKLALYFSLKAQSDIINKRLKEMRLLFSETAQGENFVQNTDGHTLMVEQRARKVLDTKKIEQVYGKAFLDEFRKETFAEYIKVIKR